MQNEMVERHTMTADYLAAAKWCAVRGLEGKRGDPLPNLMNTETVRLINANLPRFSMFVSLARKQFLNQSESSKRIENPHV